MTPPVRVASCLNTLYQKNGRLTAALVVKAASKEGSPLHSYFEWDDTVAGARYRMEQARDLIRSVDVRFTIEDSEILIPKYMRDPDMDNDEQGYVTVESLRGSKANARRALTYECDRADAVLSRARHIAVGLGLADKIDLVKDALGTFRSIIHTQGD